MGARTGKDSTAARARGIRRFSPNFRGQAIEAVQPLVALLRAIVERYAKTPAPVALPWLTENDNGLPFPGVKNSKRPRLRRPCYSR
jgi:aryl-alcohol dehydrogenase-like predicted oxidoreductase